jgi:hypothetical protein
VADRLRTTVPATASLARFEAGGFLVAVPGLRSPREANACAEALQQQFSAPYALERSEFTLRASVGVTIAPLHGTDPDRLVQLAEVARDVARRSHTGLEVFSPERNEFTDRRLALLGSLGPAVRRREMRVHFQPQVDLLTGTVSGYEALLRWEHPTLGTVPPDEFVALAEHAGLMHLITEYVLDEALCRLAAWREQECTARVSVNVSASVLQDRDLPRASPAAWPSGACRAAPRARADRDRRHVRPRALPPGDGGAARPAGRAVAGRLRHRLRLAHLAHDPADRRAQDRQGVRQGDGRQPDRSRGRAVDPAAGEAARGCASSPRASRARSSPCCSCPTAARPAQGYHFGRAMPPEDVVLDLVAVEGAPAVTLLP